MTELQRRNQRQNQTINATVHYHNLPKTQANGRENHPWTTTLDESPMLEEITQRREIAPKITGARIHR